jgi:RHS repeat-associated protein
VTRTDDYQYDTRGRLLNVARDNALVSVYDYDDNGNRLSLTNPSTSSVTLGSYDDHDRVVAYGSYEYTFNENGDLASKFNMATNEETTYEYDARGALISAMLPDSTFVEYVIDGKGRRIGKKVNGVQIQGFLYKDQLRIAAELDGAGGILSQFVYIGDNQSPDFMIKAGSVYRFVKDQLGSPRVIVNVLTGAVAQTLDFDEFGNVLGDSMPGFQPFGFAGGIQDQNTGLIRFGFRDYHPEVGIWTTKDPIRWSGNQENLYVYVSSDPVNKTDSWGLQTPEQRNCRIDCDNQHYDDAARCESEACSTWWGRFSGACEECRGMARLGNYGCRLRCDPPPQGPPGPPPPRRPNACEYASN